MLHHDYTLPEPPAGYGGEIPGTRVPDYDTLIALESLGFNIRLYERVQALSEVDPHRPPRDPQDVLDQWELVATWRVREGDPRQDCLCGRKDIHEVYLLENERTHAQITLGMDCIKKFSTELAKDARDLAALTLLWEASRQLPPGTRLPIKRGEPGWTPEARLTRGAVRSLWGQRVIDFGERNTLLKAIRARKPSAELLEAAHAIAEAKVHPWLDSWDGTLGR